MNDENKRITIWVVQFPITLNIKENLENILSNLSTAEPDDLLIFPEGSLSGYDEGPSFLNDIDLSFLSDSMKILQEYVIQRGLHVIFGTCLNMDDQWYSAGVYFGPQGEIFIYKKVNLATSERGYFTAGSGLPVLKSNYKMQKLSVPFNYAGRFASLNNGNILH